MKRLASDPEFHDKPSELTLGQHWSYAVERGASSGLHMMRTVIVAH